MTIAWAYMVETESGLSKKQIKDLMEMIPDDVEVIPFQNDVVVSGNAILESNSVAMGFIDNDHFDDLFEVQKTLAVVCNDWVNEKENNTYSTENGLEIKMLCEFETVMVG